MDLICPEPHYQPAAFNNGEWPGYPVKGNMASVKSCSKLNDSFCLLSFFLLIILNQNTSVDVTFTFLKNRTRVRPSAAVRRAELLSEHVPAHVPFLTSIFHRALSTTFRRVDTAGVKDLDEQLEQTTAAQEGQQQQTHCLQ